MNYYYYYYLLQKGKQRRAAKKAQTGSIDILNMNNEENDIGDEFQNNSILMSMAMSPENLNNLNDNNYGNGHGNVLDKNQRNILSPVVSDNDIELNRLDLITELHSNNENYDNNNNNDNNSNGADRGNDNIDSDSEGEGDERRGGDRDNVERKREREMEGDRVGTERVREGIVEDSSLHNINITDIKNTNTNNNINNSSSSRGGHNDYDNNVEISNMTDLPSNSIEIDTNESQNHNNSNTTSTSSSNPIINAHQITNSSLFPLPEPSRTMLSNLNLINHNSADVPVENEEDVNHINNRDDLFIHYPISTSNLASTLTSTLNAQDLILSHKRNRTVRDQ